MNNTQLYLSIGIPTFTVILAWVTGWVNSNRLSDKIDRVSETQNARLDRTVETLTAKMDKLSESLNTKMDRMIEQQHRDAMSLQNFMIPLHERMAKLEVRTDIA